MASLLSLVALLGLTSLVPDLASACMCSSRPTLQGAYCSPRTGYLIQAEVVNQSEPFVHSTMMRYMPDNAVDRYYFLQNHGKYRYTLRITDVYAAPSRNNAQSFLRPGNDVTLEARMGGAMCGVVLEVGKFYVVAGAVSGNKQLITGLCYYKAQYDSQQQLQLPSCPGSSAKRSEAVASARGGPWSEGKRGWWSLVGESERDARNTKTAEAAADDDTAFGLWGLAGESERERSADSNAQHPMSLLDLLTPHDK